MADILMQAYFYVLSVVVIGVYFYSLFTPTGATLKKSYSAGNRIAVSVISFFLNAIIAAPLFYLYALAVRAWGVDGRTVFWLFLIVTSLGAAIAPFFKDHDLKGATAAFAGINIIVSWYGLQLFLQGVRL